MAKGVRYTEEFRELPLQALEQFRGGARVADDGREPEDGQRFPSCVVEDRRRRRPSDRGTRQGVEVLAVRRMFCFNVCSTGSAVFFRSVG